MTREQTVQVLTILRAAYPSFYAHITQEDARQTVIVWSDLFRDDDFALVTAAVKAVISTDASGFPPNIGTIKEQMRRLVNGPETDTAMDAWNAVKKAISYYDARKNFDALPELAKSVVGSPTRLKDWSGMSVEAIDTVVQSNFLKAYRAKEQAVREFQALPDDVKRMCTGIKKLLNA